MFLNGVQCGKSAIELNERNNSVDPVCIKAYLDE